MLGWVVRVPVSISLPDSRSGAWRLCLSWDFGSSPETIAQASQRQEVVNGRSAVPDGLTTLMQVRCLASAAGERARLASGPLAAVRATTVSYSMETRGYEMGELTWRMPAYRDATADLPRESSFRSMGPQSWPAWMASRRATRNGEHGKSVRGIELTGARRELEPGPVAVEKGVPGCVDGARPQEPAKFSRKMVLPSWPQNRPHEAFWKFPGSPIPKGGAVSLLVGKSSCATIGGTAKEKKRTTGRGGTGPGGRGPCV